jgi:hypothetical protein
MDRMTDSGSVGWAFESPRDHKKRLRKQPFFCDTMATRTARQRFRTEGACDRARERDVRLPVCSEQSPRDHTEEAL